MQKQRPSVVLISQGDSVTTVPAGEVPVGSSSNSVVI